MTYWILLATSWRTDGTPRHRPKFFTAVLEGDPFAIAMLAAAIVTMFGPALFRSIRMR
jgi:hypothetical protein